MGNKLAMLWIVYGAGESKVIPLDAYELRFGGTLLGPVALSFPLAGFDFALLVRARNVAVHLMVDPLEGELVSFRIFEVARISVEFNDSTGATGHLDFRAPR